MGYESLSPEERRRKWRAASVRYRERHPERLRVAQRLRVAIPTPVPFVPRRVLRAQRRARKEQREQEWRAARRAAKQAAKIYRPRTGTYASVNLVTITTKDEQGTYIMPDGVFEPHKCEHCGCRCMGLEPVYSLAEAAALIPMPTAGALRVWLHSNKARVSKPPIYKQARIRRVRYLPLSDILRIRKIIFNPFQKGHLNTIEGRFIKAVNQLESETALRDIVSDAASASVMERKAMQMRSPAVAGDGLGGDNS